MKPIFIQQRDQTDCGVTCLLSIIQMYGGDTTLETLREQSGTSLQGTSLLGLQQAAKQQNIDVEAFEVDDIAVFKNDATFPCILHVVINEKLEHYVICNGVESTPLPTYHIIDPANGIEMWTEEELLERWKSRAVLLLNPTAAFEQVSQNRFKKIGWFKELLKEDVPMLSIAVAIGILLAVLGMATAVFSQKLIDEILPNHQTTKLTLGIGLLGILLLARAGLSYLRTFFLLRQSKDFNNRLIGSFYEKLLYLPKTFFDGRSTGEIIARINDTRRIQSVISYLVGSVVIDILVFIISSIFVFYYSWYIGLIALVSIPLFVGLAWKYNNRIIEAQKNVMKTYASTESHFVDAIGGISTVKAANKESFFTNVGKSIYGVFQETIYQLGILSNRYGLWNEFFNALMVTSILGYSSWLVLQDKMQLGELVAVLSISLGLVGAIARLATTNIQLQEAKIAFERMYEFASVKPETKTNNRIECGGVDSVSVNNLSFRFAGKRQLLKDVSLFISKKEITVLLGEVGSGKSILLQILQKFQSYESGAIIVNSNIDISAIDAKEWRKEVGVVSQEIKIFSGTVLDNIVLGNVVEEAEKAVNFCKEYGFDIYFENFPQNYLTIVGEEGVNLSGGQKQLVALARALYQSPSILLLDEPTSAMDKETEKFVMNLLQRLKSQMAILMVTHRKSSLPFADKVFELKDGICNIETNNAKMMLSNL